MSHRFAEVWQADAEWPGTPVQQLAVEKTWHLEYDTDRWRLMKLLDKSTNEVYRRSYLVVGFPPDEMFPPNLIAVAGVTGINFRQSFAASALSAQANHELGHVADKHLLTPVKRLQYMQMMGIDPNANTWNQNVQEIFADSFREWWRGRDWPEFRALLL